MEPTFDIKQLITETEKQESQKKKKSWIVTLSIIVPVIVSLSFMVFLMYYTIIENKKLQEQNDLLLQNKMHLDSNLVRMQYTLDTSKIGTYGLILKVDSLQNELYKRDSLLRQNTSHINTSNEHNYTFDEKDTSKVKPPGQILGGYIYTVQADGETIEEIAKQIYKNSRFWGAIWEANREKLPNPEDKLSKGTTLRIPSYVEPDPDNLKKWKKKK